MVYILLGTGFEEIEAVAPLDLLRRAGIPVSTVGVSGKTVYGSHGIGVEADVLPEQVDMDRLEMVVVPGGLRGVASLRASAWAMDTLRRAWAQGRYTAAICAGPTVLADLGIPEGKNAVCYPGCEGQMGSARIGSAAAVTDGRLITGTSAGCAVAFGLELIRALKGPEAADAVEKQIVIR